MLNYRHLYEEIGKGIMAAAELQEALEAQVQPVVPEDTIAEAGRKVLLGELVDMLKHEAGSRTGENVEDVHDMRVAIRRMRSLLRLLEPYYKSKTIRGYSRDLRRIGWALGDVRDLDVLLDDLKQYQSKLDAEGQAALQEMIDFLDRRRAAAREELNDVLDSKFYRRFVKDFSKFLTKAEQKAKQANGEVVPYQVRHVLPMLIHDRLAAVRAYETAIPTDDAKTMHQLRIEFKRLRYAISLFDGLLGSSINDFIEEIKRIQDELGRLNDIHTARSRLDAWLDDAEDNFSGVLAGYLSYLEAEEPKLKAEFPAEWARFNNRKVQQKLSNALLALV
jgi:CHAD domain-containing protein